MQCLPIKPSAPSRARRMRWHSVAACPRYGDSCRAPGALDKCHPPRSVSAASGLGGVWTKAASIAAAKQAPDLASNASDWPRAQTDKGLAL